jgi:hypothetical protein
MSGGCVVAGRWLVVTSKASVRRLVPATTSFG